jgi:hypothetical protein
MERRVENESSDDGNTVLEVAVDGSDDGEDGDDVLSLLQTSS